MSAFAINEICYRLVHDPPFREAMKADPAQTIANLDLSERERTALLSGEVGTLYGLGAHAFLLGHLCRYGIAGLTLPAYNDRMRAVAS
ncbi:MAG TPA: hypothetical protein VIJ64_03470 [Candidatus Lustribacter sp.]